jgi:hypothetical protein
MSNFWTKTQQLFGDSNNGAKIKDKEFENLLKKMSIIETGIKSYKKTLESLINLYGQIESIFEDFIESIKNIFNLSPYIPVIDEICVKHSIIINEYIKYSKILKNIISNTSEWNKLFDDSKELIKKREDKKKIYEHYEQKLEKLQNNKKKDKERITRNEEKYRKAANEYIDISEKSFNDINMAMNQTYDLVKVVLCELLKNEKYIFLNISNTLNYFENIDDKFLDIKNNKEILEENLNANIYDPKKYMKEKDLIQKLSVSKNVRNSDSKSDKTEEIIKFNPYERKRNTFGVLKEDIKFQYYAISDDLAS